MLEVPLYNKLINDSTIASFVSNRVYEFESIQEFYPYVTYKIEDVTEDGLNYKAVSRQYNVTVSGVSLSNYVAMQIGQAINNALNKSIGAWDTTSGIIIQASNCMEQVSDDTSDPISPDNKIYIRELTFKVTAYQSNSP